MSLDVCRGSLVANGRQTDSPGLGLTQSCRRITLSVDWRLVRVDRNLVRMDSESTLSVKPMASSGPAPALKVEHFQDCDDLALGRWTRQRVTLGGPGADWLTADAVAGRFDLTAHRTGCQCASLRASAAATYQGRVRKAAAAKGGQ